MTFEVREQRWLPYRLAFVGIELVAHAGLRVPGRPNFYDGRG